MNIKNIFLAAAAAMALTACSSDSDVLQAPVQSQFPEDGVMRFTANLNDAATVQTRASMTTSDLGSFQVKIVNLASTTYSYFETVSKTTTGDWTPANRMLWQNNTQAITMTAAALSGHTFTDDDFADGTNITVAEDQSTQAKLNAEDLLTMPTKTINDPSRETTLLSDGKLVVSLYHGLAKLNVTLTLKNEFYKAAPKLNNASDITEMTISGTNLAYNFKPMVAANENYGTVAAAATATTGNIVPFQSAFTAATASSQESVATYESIVVPQTIAAGALTVSFKIGDRSFSWTNAKAYTLEQGKLYTLPLTVGTETVTAGANTLTVSAWRDQTASEIATE